VTGVQTCALPICGVPHGGVDSNVNWSKANYGIQEPTYVPTKINLTFSASPIVTRNDIINGFSLRDYGSGKLLTSKNGKFGTTGIW
jgi:hypothetical protein